MIERLLAGEAALARDELDAAERLFSQIATADPRNAMALVGLARIAARQGDPNEARALAVRALAIDPHEAAAARLLREIDRGGSIAEVDEPTEAATAVPADTGPAAAAPALDQSVVRQAHPAPDPAGAPARSPGPEKTGWRAWLDRLLRRG